MIELTLHLCATKYNFNLLRWGFSFLFLFSLFRYFLNNNKKKRVGRGGATSDAIGWLRSRCKAPLPSLLFVHPEWHFVWHELTPLPPLFQSCHHMNEEPGCHSRASETTSSWNQSAAVLFWSPQSNNTAAATKDAIDVSLFDFISLCWFEHI